MSVTTPVAEPLFRPQDAVPMSTDPATVKPWAEAEAVLRGAPKVWLSTVRPGGRPHAAPVMFAWAGGAICVASRPGSRKGRNLAADGRCVITVSGDTLDLVVEGDAGRVTDPAGQREIIAAIQEKYGWPLTMRDGSVHDDGLPGGPEYGCYRITPVRAFGYGPDGLTATRWRFG
ncbi:pyridoxamine 5'-phosphate oxidase [Sphaerisporangium rufum]|uniref:Pyridoxamine 5'-phosphate oxidase n=1 Tax=Sphaerisporangium rufum TaxID=1381558 RepID=A0A919R7P5_9ACTN|nr:pyridoxamine 5'-phosphate oxidase family protein [Sphaerisporangium rufum]GII79750.1 pyridoxamine 5'-phosphate oxidase [Sphaerisporangium rufum]